MPSPRKELTWKPYHGDRKGGRWFKKIDNKCKYFGSAPNKSDPQAYKQAIAKYRAFMEQRDIEQTRLESVKIRQDQFEQTGRASEYAAWSMSLETAHEESKNRHRRDVLEEARRLTGEDAEGKQRPSLPNLVEMYFTEQDHRHAISQTKPESLPAKRRLSHCGLRAIKVQLKPFKHWIETTRSTLGPNSHATETMLREYRSHCDGLMLAGKIEPTTVSNYVRGLKRFINWLWQRRHIDELPRGLDEICQKYSAEKKAKAISDRDLQRIWQHADPRMRALIALSLNCGFYFSEIANLYGRDVKDGYVARRRPKTGVPSKHKLWAITLELLEETRTSKKKDELLYITRQGNPLVHDYGTRTDTINKPWRELCEIAKVKATPSQLRDTAATFIEGIGIKGGNPKL